MKAAVNVPAAQLHFTTFAGSHSSNARRINMADKDARTRPQRQRRRTVRAAECHSDSDAHSESDCVIVSGKSDQNDQALTHGPDEGDSANEEENTDDGDFMDDAEQHGASSESFNHAAHDELRQRSFDQVERNKRRKRPARVTSAKKRKASADSDTLFARDAAGAVCIAGQDAAECDAASVDSDTSTAPGAAVAGEDAAEGTTSVQDNRTIFDAVIGNSTGVLIKTFTTGQRAKARSKTDEPHAFHQL